MNIDRNLRSRTSRLLLALPVAALAFSLAACSGTVERPTAEKVSTGLKKVLEEQGAGDAVTDEIALCLSEALVDSKVSNETLKAIADGDSEARTNNEDYNLVLTTMQEAGTDCITQ